MCSQNWDPLLRRFKNLWQNWACPRNHGRGWMLSQEQCNFPIVALALSTVLVESSRLPGNILAFQREQTDVFFRCTAVEWLHTEVQPSAGEAPPPTNSWVSFWEPWMDDWQRGVHTMMESLFFMRAFSQSWTLSCLQSCFKTGANVHPWTAKTYTGTATREREPSPRATTSAG